ncbi:syntaxin-52-like isoform X2 [Phalaenopsis equestris]|uniref:syntaxin-52-like isoform X2 n=1 Tax=Phalaenopsis equestris TaxID=78828 RepID=UPI0009E330D3|nr:syntaxin-52-like isoform X2 [Phalaenopsis equestris]
MLLYYCLTKHGQNDHFSETTVSQLFSHSCNKQPVSFPTAVFLQQLPGTLQLRQTDPKKLNTSLIHMTEKELHKRQDTFKFEIESEANGVRNLLLDVINCLIREELLGQSKKSDEINRTTGLDNHGIVVLQRQIMKEQDEGLEKLEETVLSTKHIALAVNEELDLQTRLIDNLDEHVDITDSRLQVTSFYVCKRGWPSLTSVRKEAARASACSCLSSSSSCWLLLLGFFSLTCKNHFLTQFSSGLLFSQCGILFQKQALCFP